MHLVHALLNNFVDRLLLRRDHTLPPLFRLLYVLSHFPLELLVYVHFFFLHIYLVFLVFKIIFLGDRLGLVCLRGLVEDARLLELRGVQRRAKLFAQKRHDLSGVVLGLLQVRSWRWCLLDRGKRSRRPSHGPAMVL